MLRFTIRDLLWLTLVVGLIVAWWVDRRELLGDYAERARRADLRAVQEARQAEIATRNAEAAFRVARPSPSGSGVP